MTNQKHLPDERSRVGEVLNLLAETIGTQLSKEQNTRIAAGQKEKGYEYRRNDIASQLQGIRCHLEDCRNNKQTTLFRCGSNRHDIQNAITYIHELLGTRNMWAHNDPFRLGDALRAADTACRLLAKLGLPHDRMEALGEHLQPSNSQKPPRSPDSLSTRSQGSTKQIAIVTCTQKQDGNATTFDKLYIGPFYKRSRTECEKDKISFLIISTKYGLVMSDDSVEGSYNRNLDEMKEAEKREWRNLLEQHVKNKLSSAGIGHVVFLAGQKYRESLQPILDRAGITYETHRNWKKICDDIYSR